MGCGPSKSYVDDTFVTRDEVVEDFASREFMKDSYIQKTELEMEAMDPRSFVAQTVHKSVETQILASQRELDALGKKFCTELQDSVDHQMAAMRKSIDTFVAEERLRQVQRDVEETTFMLESDEKHARLGDRLTALCKVQAVVEESSQSLRDDLVASEAHMKTMNEKVWKTFHLYKCHCPASLQSGYDLSKLGLIYASAKEAEDPEASKYENEYDEWQGGEDYKVENFAPLGGGVKGDPAAAKQGRFAADDVAFHPT